MPETPDFEKIARDLVDAFNPEAMADRGIALDIAEQRHDGRALREEP